PASTRTRARVRPPCSSGTVFIRIGSMTWRDRGRARRSDVQGGIAGGSSGPSQTKALPSVRQAPYRLTACGRRGGEPSTPRPMPAKHDDLHGNAPDSSPTALVLVDVINDLEFEG